MPEVSVIIPTYNSAHFLTAAIDSVLAQTYRDFEILVIDDGSTDDTEAVMRRYGPAVQYVRQPNRGVAAARNCGISQSRGTYVSFLDADDTWYPNKLECQLLQLRHHPQYRLCYSAYLVVDSLLRPLRVGRSVRKASALEDLLQLGNIIGSICTVLCERALFKTIENFDVALSQCADWDIFIRLATRTDFLYVDEPLVTYRQHGTNMSRNTPLLEHDSVRVLEKGFAMPELSPNLKSQRARAFARNYMVLAGSYFHARRYGDFLRCATRALSLDVRQGKYLLGFPLRLASRWQSACFA